MNLTLKDIPIIFLDIDGVLNHSGIRNEKEFLQESIDVLNKVYEEIPYKIVLSTSWKDAYVFVDLVEFLHEKGIVAPIIDKTPTYVGEYGAGSKDTSSLNEVDFNASIGENQGRNKEIISYIKMHDINRYCILDDFEMTNKELRPHQVLTDWFDDETGSLRWRDYESVIKILKEK